MRRGYSYINLLVYLSLFLVLLGIVSSLFYPLINKSFGQLKVLKQEQEISRMLDLLAEEVRFADQILKTGTVFLFSRKNLQYEYLLKNKRLARQKEGVLYLTGKDNLIEDFSIQPVEPGLFNILLKTENKIFQRLARKRN